MAEAALRTQVSCGFLPCLLRCGECANKFSIDRFSTYFACEDYSSTTAVFPLNAVLRGPQPRYNQDLRYTSAKRRSRLGKAPRRGLRALVNHGHATERWLEVKCMLGRLAFLCHLHEPPVSMFTYCWDATMKQCGRIGRQQCGAP